MKTEEYLKKLTDQIRCAKARAAIAEEMRGHIDEQKHAYMSVGMEAEEAEEAAVKEMGDPVEAGSLLDGIHRPRMAWGMIGLIAVDVYKRQVRDMVRCLERRQRTLKAL